MLMIVAFPKSYIEVVVQRQESTELNNQETDDEFGTEPKDLDKIKVCTSHPALKFP